MFCAMATEFLDIELTTMVHLRTDESKVENLE